MKTTIKMIRVNELAIDDSGAYDEFVKNSIIIESNSFDSNVNWTRLFEEITNSIKRQEIVPNR